MKKTENSLFETEWTLSAKPDEYASRLINWYKENSRPLPWRDQPDAYRVWVSEIMLQQTRIEAVLPYFERFMEALPSVEALADCEDDRLMKLWEGLGYYSRARNLKKAANVILEKWEGKIPASYEDLLTLPGIGEYTAGALASIAFGIPVPAVDGNVLRVLARLTSCREDILQPSVKRKLTEITRKMVPAASPGVFNQAIMELGERVCLPNTQPKCDFCPLRELCEAHRLGCEQQLPFRAPKKARTLQEKTVLVLISRDVKGNGRVLLHKRPSSGLLAGLWELCNVEGLFSLDEVIEKAKDYRLPVRKIRELPDGKHVFSHVEWRMKGYALTVDPFSPPEDCYWVTAGELTFDYALPSAFHTYSRLLPILLESETKENREK